MLMKYVPLKMEEIVARDGLTSRDFETVLLKEIIYFVSLK